MKRQSSSPLKSKLATSVIKGVAALPYPLKRVFVKLIAQLVKITNKKSREISRRNLQIAFPELSKDELQQLVSESMVNTVEAAAETCDIWCKDPKTLLANTQYQVYGKELLDKALAKDQGLVLALPHLGNWEALNHYLMQIKPFVALYRPPRIQELDQLIRLSRERTGSILAPANKKGVMQLFKALRNNGLVVVLPDQEPGESGGIFAPFFGKRAWTMTLLSRMVQKTNAQVLMVFVERIKFNQQYSIHFREPDPEVYSSDTLTAATALNRSVEQCILQCPAQYQWSYKRYKKRPQGDTKVY